MRRRRPCNLALWTHLWQRRALRPAPRSPFHGLSTSSLCLSGTLHSVSRRLIRAKPVQALLCPPRVVRFGSSVLSFVDANGPFTRSLRFGVFIVVIYWRRCVPLSPPVPLSSFSGYSPRSWLAFADYSATSMAVIVPQSRPAGAGAPLRISTLDHSGRGVPLHALATQSEDWIRVHYPALIAAQDRLIKQAGSKCTLRITVRRRLPLQLRSFETLMHNILGPSGQGTRA